MVKIVIISDTHSHLDEKAWKYFKNCDEIWHAGDIGTVAITDALKAIKPTRAVFGNIDGNELRKEFPENLIFEIEGIKVFITHIGGYPEKYNARTKKIILEEKPKLFICGHSHILKVLYDHRHQLLHINPGAAGTHGFHQIKTIVRLEIDNGEMKHLEVIELGKRTS